MQSCRPQAGSLIFSPTSGCGSPGWVILYASGRSASKSIGGGPQVSEVPRLARSRLRVASWIDSPHTKYSRAARVGHDAVSQLDSHAQRANVALMPTRTIAYLRVSTDKQADRGVSLDAQRAKLKAYAELYELDLVDVVVDAGQSAKSLDRPGLQRALGMLKAGEAEALLVVKLDRLTRSVVDLGRVVERYFAPSKAALLS